MRSRFVTALRRVASLGSEVDNVVGVSDINKCQAIRGSLRQQADSSPMPSSWLGEKQEDEKKVRKRGRKVGETGSK